MNTKVFSTKKYVALSMLIFVSAGLTGCGSVEIGIEPTPSPDMLTYTNGAYGFKFSFSEEWTLAEEDHAVVLSQDTLTLRINHRRESEDIDPHFGRTGAPGGDFIYADKVSFMGQVIPAQAILYDLKYKAVFYNGTSPITVDDLVFSIVLEDLKTDYETLDIPETKQAEAKSILESFMRIEATGLPSEVRNSGGETIPMDGPGTAVDDEIDQPWWTYVNADYGFIFRYPPNLIVTEEANLVKVRQGALQLEIAFRRADEDVQIASMDALSGKFQPADDIHFLGLEVQSFQNIFDEQVKAVFYGGPGLEIEVGELRFAISLVDTTAESDFDRVDIDYSVQELMGQILASFDTE
jgi:hypothetical protein